MTKPNWELLKDAYAIIDGIPSKAIDLDSIREARGATLSCGTIACGMGWLGEHPKFKQLGLSTVGDRSWNSDVNLHGELSHYGKAAGEIFGIGTELGSKIFSPAGCSEIDRKYWRKLSHKELLLRRMRRVLGDAGQITNPEILKQYLEEKDI